MEFSYLTDPGQVRDHNEDSVTIVKNEAGEYIVATLYSNGSTVAEDVYTFDTVKEADLLHFLSFRNDDKTPAYYGEFTAESKDYKLDKKNLDVLDNFNVMLPTNKRTQIWGNEESPIGRYNIKGVWTLAVSANQTALEAVKVAVNAPALVKAKDLPFGFLVFMVFTIDSGQLIPKHIIIPASNNCGILNSI